MNLAGLKKPMNETFKDFDAKSNLCLTACEDLKATLGRLTDEISQLNQATPGIEQIQDLHNTFNKAQEEMNLVMSFRNFIGLGT